MTISVAVTWAPKRRPLRAPLGILEIGPDQVRLLDGDGSVLLEIAPRDLTVSLDGKWKLCLNAADHAFYIAGLAVQEARNASTREIIERHQALVVPPKPESLSDGRWRSTVTSTTWTGALADVRVQKLAWRTALIALFRAVGAPVQQSV